VFIPDALGQAPFSQNTSLLGVSISSSFTKELFTFNHITVFLGVADYQNCSSAEKKKFFANTNTPTAEEASGIRRKALFCLTDLW